MNELENRSPEVEAQNPEVVEESVPAAPSVMEESEVSEVKSDGRRFHEMSKQELIDFLKDILDNDRMEAHKEVNGIKSAFTTLRNAEENAALLAFVEEGNAPETFVSQPDELESEFRTLIADFRERRNAYLEAQEKVRIENLETKRKIIEELKEIVSDIDNINLHFPKAQQLQQDFKTVGEVPSGNESDIWKEYQAVVEQFYDHLKMNKELRDLDFKKNLEAKQRLVEEAKALESAGDVVIAFRSLQNLHKEWREIGPVAKELRDEIWDQFKASSTVINKRYQDFFEERKARELENEQAKTKLCEEAEAIDVASLNTLAAWKEASDKIIALQADWKKLGFASKKVNNSLYARFRECCDKFFNAKNDHYKEMRDSLSANLAAKTALCEKVEALKENGESIEKNIEVVMKLQAEWKTIGPCSRKHSDVIWKRFSDACNYFFDERRKANSNRRREEGDNLVAKREIIAKLKEIPTDIERKEAMPRIKELQAQWNAIGFVPMKHKDSIYAEYREVCDALYGAYNQRESNRRMSNFSGRVEELKGDQSKLNRERDRLLRAYEQRRADLNNYENNLGFFNVKSSAGSAMVKDLERRINTIRQDMKEIEAKIALIDSKE